MEENKVKKYFKEFLIPTLVKTNITKDYLESLVKNIEEQMYSLLKHWNEPNFRESILLLGADEGIFYEPQEVRQQIRFFVVVTIRNSLFETLVSNDCKSAGLKYPLSDEDIKFITKSSIEYFKDTNMKKLSKELDYSCYEDVYLNISNKYKMAWRALNELSFCSGKEKYYGKIAEYNKINIEDLPKLDDYENGNGEKIIKVIESGITPLFNTRLIEILKKIIEVEDEDGLFWADSFKYITRNFEKLLQVIEILLQNNKSLVTNNYYISNNYVAKREKILRASHNFDGMDEKRRNLEGLSSRHAEVLSGMSEVEFVE